MSSARGAKLNQILKKWPSGTVATASWLESNGIYHQLSADYERSAWIKRIGHGAFVRDDGDDPVEWEGALYAIQTQLELPIHAAAKTALTLQGASHFASADTGYPVYLFGVPHTKLPTWFMNHSWRVKVKFTTTNLFTAGEKLGLTEKRFGRFSIVISNRERAILELLHLVPNNQAFDEAKLIFEALRTLRPELLQTLLEKCRSIKVKRLFLHLADSTNQPWLKEIKVSKIDLGSGKRVIGSGGTYDSKYGISVPSSRSEEGLDGA